MSSTHVSSETRMFGDLAAMLLQESRRSMLTNTLLKHNQNLVHLVTREIWHLDSLLDPLDSQDAPASEGTMCAAVIYDTAMEHNKRALLAYHDQRLRLLKNFYWAGGCALPLVLNAPHIRPNLSPNEVDFLRQYDDLVKRLRDDFRAISGEDDLGGNGTHFSVPARAYCENCPELGSVDITGDIMVPPKDLHATVRVVRECGSVATELGTIEFKMGERYLVRKVDVEHLIVQGYLEVV